MAPVEPITITIGSQTSTYSVGDLGEVAQVRYQGGWIAKRVLSPQEAITERVTTREYAEALAYRHAERLAS